MQAATDFAPIRAHEYLTPDSVDVNFAGIIDGRGTALAKPSIQFDHHCAVGQCFLSEVDIGGAEAAHGSVVQRENLACGGLFFQQLAV